MKRLFDYTAIMAMTLLMASCTADYKKADTFQEADDPVVLTDDQVAAWGKEGSRLHAAWVDTDFRYSRSIVPEDFCDGVFHITAWKGERVSAQILLWSAEAKDGARCEIADFKAPGAVMPSSVAQARFVRYTLADEQKYSFKRGEPAVLAPDMLDTLDRFDMAPRSVRPIWITVNVPQDVQSGLYSTKVSISYQGFGRISLPLEVEVVDHVLPVPGEWDYYLDLWQHPASVARTQGLEIWSDEHFEALKPVMKRLAEAGQKVVTATLNKDPWNHQCYDGYAPMILWTKHEDGSWSYDYTVFDRWVQMMLDLGIDKAVNCYSMVPWNCELEYMDEKEGRVVTVKAEPGTPVFPVIWTPFLKDFKRHLAEKGWLEITNIAMDERSPEAMSAAADLLTKCAPEMGFALADNHRSYKEFTMMRDVCVSMHHNIVDHEDILARREKGFTTTFYICCGPMYPNTFTTSQPYEAEMLGWYNLAHDYDGMLRWAYNSWAEDPQYDSRYGNWMSGDTYLVYPYNRSSIRFERLIDGIETAEKVRQLRREGADIAPVEAVLDKIRMLNANNPEVPWHQIMVEARTAIDEVSRR